MPKRRTPKEPRPTEDGVENSVRHLVMIDETPIRARVMEEHRLLEEQATVVRERIDFFENSDLPAYTRWEARVLGPILTAIREAEQSIRQKQTLLEAIEDEMFFMNVPRLTAYKRVIRAMEEGEPLHREEDEESPESEAGEPSFEEPSSERQGDRMFGDRDLPKGFEAADFDRFNPAQKREFRASYAQMAMLFEAITGRVAPDLEDVLRASRQKKRTASGDSTRDGNAPSRPPKTTAQQRVGAELKKLYRFLVRKLHPDHNPGQTAHERELWHTVQQAYQKGDVEALEAIAARVDLGPGNRAGQQPVAVLLRLIRDLTTGLRALKTRLAGARKHPAWNFTARAADLVKMEARQRQDLDRHLRALQTHLAKLSADLDELARRAAKPTRSREKKPAGAPKVERQPWQEDLFSM